MFKYAWALAIIGVITGGSLLIGQSKDETPKKEPAKIDPKVKELMAKKLELSQKILAALVMNDLDKAAKHAEGLLQVRKDISFMIIKTKDYEFWGDEFTKSAEKIIKAAKEKNFDTAKLGYLEMTLNCFHCHTYVRDYPGV